MTTFFILPPSEHSICGTENCRLISDEYVNVCGVVLQTHNNYNSVSSVQFITKYVFLYYTLYLN